MPGAAMTAQGSRVVVGIVVAMSLLLAGCDPSWAVVAKNSWTETMLVGRVGTAEDGGTLIDVVQVPPGSEVKIRSFRADSWPDRVVIMTEGCTIVAAQALGDAYDEGGLIEIRGQTEIEFRPGGNPPSGTLAATTTRCEDTVKGSM